MPRKKRDVGDANGRPATKMDAVGAVLAKNPNATGVEISRTLRTEYVMDI